MSSNPDPKIGLGGAPTRATILPTDAEGRKQYPMASGCLFYFPDALAEVSNLSKRGNDQHNPGQPLHWNRSKSGDEADTLLRHLAQSGTRDVDGVRHSAKVAWRALALLQKEIESDSAIAESDRRETVFREFKNAVLPIGTLATDPRGQRWRLISDGVWKQEDAEDTPSLPVSDGQQHVGYVCPDERKMGMARRVMSEEDAARLVRELTPNVKPKPPEDAVLRYGGHFLDPSCQCPAGRLQDCPNTPLQCQARRERIVAVGHPGVTP